MKIGIVTRREENPKLALALEAIRHWAKAKSTRIIYSPEKRLKECDVLVAVGGDGTVLAAAHLACEREIPIAGINAGRVGFLAEYGIEEIPAVLDSLASGSFSTQSRIMLDCSVFIKKKKILSRTVLNEIYLRAYAPGKMINLEVELNGNYLTEYWADGLMLATPTGSTAYSLSAGGPIIYPSAEAFVLTPVNSISLSVRPLIIPSSDVCKIKCVQGNIAEMVFDGHFTEQLNENAELRICRSRFVTKFVHADDSGFVRALREKLGWKGFVGRF
ncbi:MAG: NAD(+)/NADH kinase [Fibromonadaceae bacterium]|jgi:NAD+ kinase|nr:NAD(+)/NADH kinase [Fibromonadaceae bacterium]